MADNLGDLNPREARYRVVDHAGLSVEVEGAADDVDAYKAELLDISSGGAKLKVSKNLPATDSHTLKITSDDFNGPLYVDVEVCWSRLKTTGDWWIGCSFQPRIPDDVLDRLTSGGVIDRRENQRDPISIETAAQWELELEKAPVRIVDISKEGFCLTSRHCGLPGSRVLLRLEEHSQDSLVTARIRWQIEEDDGYTMGCEVTHESRPILRQVLNSRPGKNSQSAWRRLLGLT